MLVKHEKEEKEALMRKTLVIPGAIILLAAMLVSSGVRLIPHTCGPTEEVLRAFARGQLPDDAFLMPGCCRQRRRFRGGHRGGQCAFDAQEDTA